MNRRRWSVLAGLMLGVIVVIVAGSYLRYVQSEEPERLGEADLLGGGSHDPLSGPSEEYSDVDNLEVDRGSIVRTSSDTGFVLVTDSVVAEVDAQGHVNHSSELMSARRAKVAVSSDGLVATVPSTLDYRNVVQWFQPTDGQHDYGIEVTDLYEFPFWEHDRLDPLPQPESMAFTPEGDLLLSRPLGDPAGIDVVSADREHMWRLLGRPGDNEAEIELDEPLDLIASLLALTDDRLIFVADHPSRGRELYLLDDGEIETIEDVSVRTIPEAGIQGPLSLYARPLDHLDHGPDDTVLVVGMVGDEANGYPRISQLDVDTGEVEVLIDLEGVEVGVDTPVSAAAVGDDLVFLADGKLWILDDAFSD